MQKLMFALSLGIAGFLLASHAAQAQRAQCAERTAVVERLQEKYGETRQSIGLGQQNTVIEVFASIETGTWTILFTRPDGIACLVASGESYEAGDGQLLPTGEKA